MKPLVALGLVLFLTPIMLAGDDATKGDLAKLQGTWIFKQEDGTPHELHMVFEKERVRLIYVCCKNGERRAKARIDATANPRLIDLTFDEGTLEGIYRLDGDTLELYFGGLDQKDRPTEFPREPRKDRYMKLERQK